MPLIRILLTLGLPLLLGWAVLTVVLRGQFKTFPFAERVALAFGLGWGLNTVLMFDLALLSIPLTFNNIALTAIGLALGCSLISLYLKRSGQQRPVQVLTLASSPETLPTWLARSLSAIFLLVISLKTLFVFWSAFIKPVFDPDIIKCYALGAKTIFLNHTFLVTSPIGQKPLLPFLSQAWSVIGTGSFDDSLLALAHPFLFGAFLVIFYFTLRRYHAKLTALLAATLLATIPFLVFQAGTAYTDFLQAFYYSTATIYLYLFVRGQSESKDEARADLLIGLLLLGLTVLVKKSGLYYAAIDLTVLFGWCALNRKLFSWADLKTLLIGLLYFGLIVAPWLVYHQLATFHEYYGEAASVSFGSQLFRPESGTVLLGFFRGVFFEDNWHLLYLLFLAGLLWQARANKTRERRFLPLILALQFGALFILFRFTDLYQFILNETLLNRLLFHFTPLALYCSAAFLAILTEE
jgi:4-amino-4-deoxy-L-arabinose transferase-like glycosyltransferase